MDPAQTNIRNSQGVFSQMPSTETGRSITDIIFEEHLITPEQYSSLKVESANKGIPIDQALLDNKFISDEKYYEARAKLINVPFVSIDTLPSSPEALGFIAKPLAERLKVVPFAYDKDRNSISLAMSDPLDLDALNFIRQKTGISVLVFQGIPREINEAIQNQYSAGLVGEVKEALKETEQINQVKTFDKESIASVIQDAPIAKIVATTLEYAMKSRASDIHIEPQEDRVRVRYRIDGILYERLSLPKGVQEAVTSRIKILSDLKIDEHRSPQDGRFNFKFGTQEVDLRVSVLPIAWGEKIVMRLLRKSGGVPTLNDLGLRGNALKNLEASILRPHGIVIVVGPTGSGKTSSLYSLLSRLNTTRVNIMTLEDPIEYQIQGINQVQINTDIGLTFASGLRAFLRQDPNIILVGEIRDKETTELAIQASLTGHLVFSTLHTSNAAGTIPRLMDMGAETFLLASTLNAVIGQRIARKICTQCKIEYVPPNEIIEEIRKELGPLMPPTSPNASVKLYKGKGCDFCGQSGFLGRVGIFEVMPVSEKISRLILEKSDAQTIENQARTEGMITMKQDGYLKVLEGVSTVDEILRVAQN
jgi:type IV pilus assembly protein PilB